MIIQSPSSSSSSFIATQSPGAFRQGSTSAPSTSRGKSIIGHTPMARFGEPQELFGSVHWLLSPASEFVTGVVVPIDGGFSAYSGV